MGKRINQMNSKWSQQDIAPAKTTTATPSEEEIAAKMKAAREALAREEADATN